MTYFLRCLGGQTRSKRHADQDDHETGHRRERSIEERYPEDHCGRAREEDAVLRHRVVGPRARHQRALMQPNAEIMMGPFSSEGLLGRFD